MKKTLLTLAAALVALGAAAALPSAPQRIQNPLESQFIPARNFPAMPAVTKAPAYAAAEAATSIDYTPAGSPQLYLTLDDFKYAEQVVGMQVAQAFQMTSAETQKFAGNQIKSIFFYTGVNLAQSTQQKPVNTIRKATLFITTDLKDFAPEYTQKVDLPENALTIQSFTLDTPYEIEAGKPFYVGYYYHLSSTDDATLITDYTNHGTDVAGGWLGVRPKATDYDPDPKWTFNNIAKSIGFLCVGAVIEGDNLPQNEVSVPIADVQPTVYQNEKFPLYFLITNNAANQISTIDCEVTVGNNATQTEHVELDAPLAYKRQAVISIGDLSYAEADIAAVPVKLNVTKVNGADNNSKSASQTVAIQVLPTGKGFQRNVVVEEFTGSWCGYCPQGIVTMEKLRETYTDGSVIPVAIHFNDEMVSPSFSAVNSDYCSGNYPSAIMNRYMYVSNLYPTEYCIEEIEDFGSYPAPANVTATATFNEKKNGIIFDTKTSFTFDNENAAEDYILSFAVTEDNVGPYQQHSYYTQQGELPGWPYTTEYVSVIYNDVARQLNSYQGITGSVPASVEQGKEYDFQYEMKFLAASKISNWINLNAIVYLINRKTGMIENACMVKAGQLAAIDEVTINGDADADAPVEYFNLQGIRVAQPESGIYIRRQGSTAKVVSVK